MAPIPDTVWSRAREALGYLLKGLQPSQSQQELASVQQAIVYAVLSGQAAETIDPLSFVPGEPNDSSDQRAFRQEGITVQDADYRLVDSLRPPDASLVVNQLVRLRPVDTHASSQMFVRNGNAVHLVPFSTSGPLVDLQGRRLELVVFRLSTFAAVRDGLYINTNLIPVPNAQYNYTFGACTMWVPAKGFVASAPENGYFGLRLKGGSSYAPPVPGSYVQLQLEPQAAWPAPLGPRFSRTLPTSLNIGYSGLPSPGRPSLSSFSASCVLFGHSLDFHYQPSNGNAEYDVATGRILFPLVPGTSSITIAENDADLVHFSGRAEVTRAYWALPVVPFTTRPQFAPVSTNGSLLVRVTPGLRSRFASDKDIWTYGEIEIAVDETAATISGLTAWTSATRSLNLWLHGNPASQGFSARTKRSTVAQTSRSISANVLKRGFPFKYFIQSSGQESWTYSTGLSGSFSAPVSIDGARMPFVGLAVVLFTRKSPGLLPYVSIEARSTPYANEQTVKRASYLAENMLLVVDLPRYLFTYGEYSPDDRAIVTGSLNLPATLLEATPVLPDPYVSNIVRLPADYELSMRFQFFFDGIRDPLASLQLSEFALGRIVALDKSPFNPSTDQFKLPASDLAQKIEAKQLEQWESYSPLIPFLANDPTLLDISSNSSHLGISFSSASGTGSIPLTVANTTFSAPANNLKVFGLPSVQWEAVYIEDEASPGSGSDISYPSAAGYPTKISTRSASLVPLNPSALLQKAVSAYNPLLPGLVRPLPVTANFMLPFGMLTQATATNPSRKSLRLVQPSFEREVPPAFQAPSSTGKATLTSSPNISFQSRTVAEMHAGFAGLALLPNTPQSQSPYPGVITSQFNAGFVTHSPLTRFSLSGYGASIFSNWSPLPLPNVGISKVEMDVLLGRANRQVVQMISLMYPFGVRVIRTVTILRQNNGVVVGSDSGWVACSDGVYDFGDLPAGQERANVHFGLVRGVKDVRNIRLVDKKGGNENLVSYDCLMEIEGVDGAATETSWVPVQGQIGYIVTRTPGTNAPPKPLSPAEYVDLLSKNRLGGPVDVIVRLRNSEQKVRVSRVLAGNCTNDTAAASTTEFPMELWGTPIVPASGGQWAFTKVARSTRDPQVGVQEAVDSWGVPLVRQGLDVGSSVVSAIKVSGAASLFEEVSGYNLIHSGDSYRVMFPSPALIPGATPGELVKGLTSAVEPILADSFALAASTTGGIFPELEKCIPLKDANRVLDVIAGGHYEYKAVLEEGKKLALEEAKRFLKQDGNFASVVSTAGNLLPDGTTNAYLDMAISTIKGTKDLSLTNLSMITQGAAGKELNKVVGSVLSSAKDLPVFKDAEHIFGELLGQVQKVVNFLNKLKVLPPLKVSITNEWAMEVSTSMGLDDFLKKLGPGAQAIKEIVQALNFALKARTTPTSANFTLSIDVTIKIPTGLGPFVLGTGGFLVRAGTDGNVVRMTIGAGIGVAFQVGPFGASAYYTQSQSIIISKELYGVAATCVLKVHVSLVVATADLMLEARLGLIGGPCRGEIHDGHPNKEDTIYVYAQVRIALHVSIFMVINVSVDETAEWENNMNKGPCLLKDMEPMPES
ncbi:hypothetical protein QBC37DRAFT_162207 [Rhypophila decipiens]|uniref:Uncharacterized protein n=1 Tax=Rhypophila decipiens TaxID=261697 RepID=A0AAN6Y781_9PEZI|nr:hypothetical protein QBC37DRAFT_162207 [Rhypophila decipiens]